MRIIKCMEPKYFDKALDFVEKVFAEFNKDGSGKGERWVVEDIRAGKFYMPELELIMVDENDEIIGYVMFSRFTLDEKYEDELLILTPVCVKTELQRQHISKELIEYGFEKAVQMGFKAVLVEGGPKNYNARGFKTSSDYGIVPSEEVRRHLPKIECLMIKELYEGSLDGIRGTVDYSMYPSLCEE